MDEMRVVAEGLQFPEGPVAMADGSVILVELSRQTLSRVLPSGAIEVVAETGGGPNGAAIGPDGAMYLCNNGSAFGPGGRVVGRDDIGGRIQRVDLATGKVENLYTECDGRPLLAPNDLVFDRTGNMWFTDHGIDTGRVHERGGLFYASPDGTMIKEVLPRLEQPNGVGLSPDDDVVYWAETNTGRIFGYPLKAPGVIAETKGLSLRTAMRGDTPDFGLLLAGTAAFRLYDSLAVEADGRVCVGTLVEGGISIADPADRSLEFVPMPAGFEDSFITNICFGGDDMRTAFLTCSMTGRLVSCRWPRPGLKLAYNG
ncbi:MAG: SMP-30/gluconolactonase/LRE family protein [Acidimicrobiia bacterium]